MRGSTTVQIRRHKVTEDKMKACFLIVLWLLSAGIEAQNKYQNRVQQSVPEVHTNKRPPFKSWNSQMYPVWKGSEAQKRDCWKGGQVTFNLQNDAPTLTGAKATFFIQLNFPHNQTVLPDGQIVWSQNRTNNGTWLPSGEPVYPDGSTEGSKCTFPDGRPFPQEAEQKRSKFVYVWQVWGKYWQVVDGASSNLTVETDGVPLGSYTMEVVVYHYRGRQKFIPIGSTSSQFAITDQIPISVSITQVLDLDQNDQRFIQNRAVSFSVAVHDPSEYLKASDISFSWDFGDQSGILITRNTGVTHTYVSSGVYNAKATVQAAIPISSCGSTTAQVATTELSFESTTEAAVATTNGGQESVAPSDTSVPVPGNSTVSVGAAADLVTVDLLDNDVESASVQPESAITAVPEDGTQVTDEAEAVTLIEAVPTEESTTTAEVTESEVAVTLPEAVQTPDTVPSQPGETGTQTEGPVASAAESTEAAVTSTGIITTQDLAASNETVPATETEVLLIAKRQAPEGPLVGCLMYRYGTFATDLEIVSGIESVQIVQVEPIVAVGLENTVDLTITCQGSVPRQVCTVISDADCENPQETVCNPVEPSDCQLVLRQAFNNSGVFCVNVSLANDVSLAVASAQVTVSAGAVSSVNGIAILVGVLLTAFAVATVAYTYRRTKTYTLLGTGHSSVNWFPDRPSLRLFIQNVFGRALSGENSPLLNGRVV
ncbi:melanocyte protein PMEL isoform X2 [Pseudophryne corroboree]|uniref:melanocyte protein PMEL isoform X2 n=1 Tax=Pseudophryne corroboree TaxID=495146 RepID=UPI003081DBD3